MLDFIIHLLIFFLSSLISFTRIEQKLMCNIFQLNISVMLPSHSFIITFPFLILCIILIKLPGGYYQPVLPWCLCLSQFFRSSWIVTWSILTYLLNGNLAIIRRFSFYFLNFDSVDLGFDQRPSEPEASLTLWNMNSCLYFAGTEGINCFVCNSRNEPYCEFLVRNDSQAYLYDAPCNEFTETGDPPFCRKIVQYSKFDSCRQYRLYFDTIAGERIRTE